MHSSRLKWSAVQHLRDVNVFEIEPCPPGDTLLVHQAGHIGRYHVLGPVAEMIVDLLEPHPGGYSLIRHAERTAKAAAVIWPIYGHEHQAFHF